MAEPLKCPYPWFGGKSKVARAVWERLGDCDNYVECFAGSLAVLLLRPSPPRVETVNDLDCMVANFWRSTQADPEAVAAHADGPVNEADLHSRHRWLVLSDDAAAFRARMRTDPHYHDAKIAGWWCWGLCCWIGAGWCSTNAAGDDSFAPGRGPAAPRANGGNSGGNSCGVHAEKAANSEGFERPALVGDCGGSPGVNPPTQKRPRIGGGSQGNTTGNATGVNSALPLGRPQLADAYDIGRGVNASAPKGFSQQVPRLGARFDMPDRPGVLNPGLTAADGTCAARRAWLVDWFSRLRDRLRLVRVCCGDWSRVCSSESVTTRLGTTGVFLDPPYGAKANRSAKLYAQDSLTVADDVRRWCLEYGPNKLMRICLAGYAGEGHEELEANGWSVVEWQADGGYGNRSVKGKENARKERLWFSPHCLFERSLFDAVSTASEQLPDASDSEPESPENQPNEPAT